VRNITLGAIAALVLGLMVVARADAQGAPQKPATPATRGQYLVTVGACNDCHTPWKPGPQGPAPDPALALSGHPAATKMPDPPKPVGPWLWSGAATNTAFAGPWGVSYGANLTPDPETGLGKWTEKMFVDAMRTGRHAGVGRPILPPMPWPSYKQMTDDDLKAVFAYLQSVKPISNRVPEPVIAQAPR
jgi:mono/diheme cytochrome c family protein